MKIVEGGIRSELGRKSIPSYYREHASNQIHIFDDVFHVEKHNFITETDKGAPTKYQDLWTVWAPIVPLIERLKHYRELDMTENLIKVMADTGKGKTKVCFCIIPFGEIEEKQRRSTYAEGGVLSKISKPSGINKCILYFSVPEIKGR